MNSGEVEDFVYNVDLTKDYGDLGSPYPTTVTQNGPRHVITNNPVWLGNTAPDFETNGQPSNNADADDLRLTDDEDGVVFPTLFPGIPAEIQVSIKAATSQTACLSGFVDWTGSGTLSPLEYIEIHAAGPGGTLVVHVSWLRKIVEPEPAQPVIIVTQRGVGYMFVPGDDHPV